MWTPHVSGSLLPSIRGAPTLSRTLGPGDSHVPSGTGSPLGPGAPVARAAPHRSGLLVAASRDAGGLLGAALLPFGRPVLRALHRLFSRRMVCAQVERPLGTEAHLIERLVQCRHARSLYHA